MGTKERREREKVETRERILAAARDMFAHEGYEAVTMRAIAQRIEYTPTALYHHFPSKQALLTELCEQDFAGLAKLFVDHAGPSDPVERLTAIGRAYLRFGLDHPSHYRFMFMTVLPEGDPAMTRLLEGRDDPERNAYAFLRNTCAEAIAQKRFRPEFSDPDQVAQMLWSNIHGLISLRVTKSHQDFVPWKDAEQTASLSMEALLRGMLREAS